MRRSGGRHFIIVACGEQPREVVDRASCQRDVHHRADEKADHVVQEPVRLDLEDEPSLAIRPCGVSHATPVVV